MTAIETISMFPPQDRLDRRLSTARVIAVLPSDLADSLDDAAHILPLARRAVLAWRHHRRYGRWVNRRRQN